MPEISQVRQTVATASDAQAAPLGNKTEIASRQGRESKPRRRDVRFIRRHTAQQRSYAKYADEKREIIESGQDPSGHKLPRTFWCGHKLGAQGGRVDVKRDPAHGQAHYSGVKFCGSVWACPVCSAIIRRQRAQEVAEAVSRWQTQGHGLYLVTATLKHHRGDDLRTLLDVLTKAWRATVSGKAWQEFKKSFGIRGYVKSLEITHGENGWHPHLHLLVFADGDATEQGADVLGSMILPRWQRYVTKLGGRLPNSHGVDVRPVDDKGRAAASYITKLADESGIALEIARADDKESSFARSVTPFQLLDEDTPKCRALWSNYLEATKGRSSITFSRGLRKLLGMVSEKTDAEIVADLEDVGEKVAEFEAEAYEAARRGGATLGAVLSAIERGAHERVCELIGCKMEWIEQPDYSTGEIIVYPRYYMIKPRLKNYTVVQM